MHATVSLLRALTQQTSGKGSFLSLPGAGSSGRAHLKEETGVIFRESLAHQSKGLCKLMSVQAPTVICVELLEHLAYLGVDLMRGQIGEPAGKYSEFVCARKEAQYSPTRLMPSKCY